LLRQKKGRAGANMAEKQGAHADAPTVNNRRDLRSPVEIIAELFVSESVRFKVAVHDLSSSGFRIETANHIPLGRLVYLTIPGLQSLQAQVAWNDRENYGCTFSKPLHSATCTHLSMRFPKLFS
jgi:PilZ domain